MRRIHDDVDRNGARRRAQIAPAQRGAQQSPRTELERGPTSLESLQKSAGNSAVQEIVSAGERVPPSIRAAAERKLGRDLGDVRIHTDAAASAYAQSVGGEAVTIGKDVYFGDGAPDISTSRGQKTYVHELTHAAQATPGEPPAADSVNDPRSTVELEARQLARAGLGGMAIAPAQTAPAGVAHRQVTTEEEERAEDLATPTPARAVPAAATASPTATAEPAPVSGAPSAPEASSPLRELFRVAVDQRIIAAQAALSAGTPEPRLAARELEAARDGVRALVGSFRDRDPLMSAGLAALGNGITSVILALKPHIGETPEISEIARLTGVLLGSAASVGSRLR